MPRRWAGRRSGGGDRPPARGPGRSGCGAEAADLDDDRTRSSGPSPRSPPMNPDAPSSAQRADDPNPTNPQEKDDPRPSDAGPAPAEGESPSTAEDQAQA